MPSWTCEVIGVQADGTFTWRRQGAREPRGVLPTELAPFGIAIGDLVTIWAERDTDGRWLVVRCEKPNDRTQERNVMTPAPPTDKPLNIHYLKFGQIRWCNVRNPLENCEAIGKWRPSLLVSEEFTKWRIMGFTTKSVYESGHPRVEIPNYRVIGLDKTGYLWGHKLTRVDTTDIGDAIGEADIDLLKAVLAIARADLRMAELAQLRRAISGEKF